MVQPFAPGSSCQSYTSLLKISAMSDTRNKLALRPCRLIRHALLLYALLIIDVVQAHSIVPQVLAEPGVLVSFVSDAAAAGSDKGNATQAGLGVQFVYSGSFEGIPANANYRVYAPDAADQPFQTGRSDGLGRVLFMPDQAGLWRIELRTEKGHEATASVAVSDDLAAPPASRWGFWLLLISFSINLTLLVFLRELWMKQRKAAQFVKP